MVRECALHGTDFLFGKRSVREALKHAEDLEHEGVVCKPDNWALAIALAPRLQPGALECSHQRNAFLVSPGTAGSPVRPGD